MKNRMMYMACVSLACLTLMGVAACRGTEGPKPEELAARTAKIYYDYLLEGKYEAFIDGFYQPDSIPPSYRSQMILSAKQYVDQMKQDHDGLNAVNIAHARVDTAQHVGHAYLMLTFNDSTHEEIVVPMVLHRNNWMMK